MHGLIFFLYFIFINMILQVMKNRITINRVRLTFITAFIFVGIFMLATYNNVNKTESESRNVKSALDVLLQLQNISADIQLIEAGQRGFTNYGNVVFLDLYNQGMKRIRRDTSILAQLTLTDSTKFEERTKLLSLLNKKLWYSKSAVEAMRINRHDSVAKTAQAATVILITDSITATISSIENKDRLLLQESNVEREKYAKRTAWQFLLLAIFFYLILYYSFKTIKNDFGQLQKNEKTLKFNASIIQNISDPVITTDAKYNITNWNVYAEKLYGYKEQEVIGKEVEALLNIKIIKPLHTETLPDSFENDYWKGEAIHHHKNGNPINVELSTSSIKGAAGEKLGIVNVIRDITQRKNMEYRLQQLTVNLQQQVKVKVAELNNVFERIADAFIALDNQWNYTYVNKKAAELHGKKAEDLIGKNIWDEFPDVADEPFYSALQMAKQTQQPQRLQLYYFKKDKWFEDLIYPSADGISVYYLDITIRKKAEISLEKVHQKLSYHIKNTPMGVIEFDSNLKILQWNKLAEQIFGWSENEVLAGNLNIDEVIYEEDKTLLWQAVKNLAGNYIQNNVVDTRNKTKDGKIIYCEWYNSVLKDDKGNTVGIMSLVQDVTGRKQIEHDLLEAESKFRSLVEQSMVGVYIVQNEKLVYVNPTFAKIFGYGGNEIAEQFPPEKIIHIDDRQKVLHHIRSRIEGKYKSMNYEFKGVHKSGELLYLEVFGSFTIYRGKPAIIGSLINVTERKKSTELLESSEQKLKISNERFLLVAKATNDAVWDWDMQTDKIWGNESFRKIFGLVAGEDFSFEQFTSRIHKEDLNPLLDNFKKSLKKSETLVTEEFRLRDRDGNTYRTLYDRAYILFNEDKRAYRMLGAMQDITQKKESEKKLITEKELSDSIINSLPGIFYLFNTQGKFYRWNKNVETVTGYTGEEIKKLYPLDLFNENQRELLQRKLSSVFELGEDSVEADLISKDGREIPYYFTGMLINYEGEACLMGVGIDISERIKSQQKLKESEEKFRSLIEQASDGIFISNQAGDYLDVNSSASVLVGYTKEELLKLNIKDIITEEDLKVKPLRIEELLSGQVIMSERFLKHKNGNLINVEISAKLLADGRFQAIVRDITARKKSEEALRISENKYRLLFNQNPMPMWMISIPERNFLDVNPAAIAHYGYSKEEFLKMNIRDIRPVEDLKKMEQQIATQPSGIFNAGIWQHKKKDGTIVQVNIITHNIFYEGKQAKLVLANDITEKIIAEENLKKSHEELRQLAANLENIRESERTHMAREIHDELGQQLTGLKMDISWLNRKIQSADEEVHNKIKDTIQLIDKTVITVRRIATELRPSILDDLGLIAAMEWQSEEFQKRAEIKTTFKSNVHNANLQPALATGVFRIYQESLTNVLRHALATEVKSSLIINAGTLELVITDNGKGFNPQDIEHKKTLGLLGMKERTLIMGGTYEISGKPGMGTSVRIIVPLK